MSISVTSICNNALILLSNTTTIFDINEDTEEARLCEKIYEMSRDALLVLHPWNFAIGRASLSQDGSTPDFEFSYAFQKPADCLRALSLYNDRSEWKSEGNLLLTNSSTANLIYIKKVTDPTMFSPMFVQCLCLDMAFRMSKPLTGSESESLANRFTFTFKEAKKIDAKEGTAPRVFMDAFTSGIRD